MLQINEVTRLYLGIQGENLEKPIEINAAAWLVDYPNGTISIWHKRNGDSVPSPTGATLDRETGVLTWNPTNTDTYVDGEGTAEIRLTESSVIKKSKSVVTVVSPSVTGAGSVSGSGWQDYINIVEGYKNAAEVAQEAAEDAQEAAEDARDVAKDAQAAAEAARDAAQAAAGDFQGITATASGLEAGADPTVAVTHSEGGLYNFGFGIPKGDKGDQGDPPTDAQVQTAANTYLATVITNPDSPPLDRSLSSNSSAAPADMVGDLKSAIDVVEDDEYTSKTFEAGDAYGSVGNQLIPSSSTTACIILRSDFSEKYIKAKEGYDFKVFLTNSSNVVQSGGTSGNYVKEYNVPDGNEYKITVVAKKSTSASISTTEAKENILFGFALTKTTESLKRFRDKVEKHFSVNGTSLTWDNNQIDTSTGDISSANTARMACAEFLPIGDAACASGGSMSIHMYNEYFAYLGYTPTWNTAVTVEYLLSLYATAKYMRILYKRDSGNPTPSSISDYAINVSYDYDESNLIKNTYGDFTIYDKLQQGGFTASGLNDGTNSLRIRIPDYIPVTAGDTYRIIVNAVSADASIQLSISFYSSKDFVTARTGYTSFIAGRIQDITIPTGATYMRVLVAYVGNGAIVPTAVRNFVVQHLTLNKKDNYVIASNFMKNRVAIEYLGSLPNDTQSFIIYDGKYYSFNNEGKLTVQDSSFSIVSTKTLTVGHANGFQLGNDDKAYISGWDDNKVYILDMETLEITGSITLPTTGYTTCAIDDVNKIAYIFQRDTYPTTIETYTFIVYDYDNEETIKTKKLPVQFAAMQGCDFADGRIIVLNGGGTSQIPNGFKVYDTDGNMLSSFILNSFSTNEPEGVFVDRDTFDVYMCFYYAPLFKIKTL